ncbi:MAG: hypothetical protein ACO2PO_21420 [Candidatus Calescibacterium sp.]|jgi:hypothetical protein
MEAREVIEAKKIVERVANILNGHRKMEYVSEKIAKLDEVYNFSKEFEPVQRATRKIEIAYADFLKNKLSIPEGIYFITNIWIYEDEIYNYLVSFVFRTKPNEEVVVYGKRFNAISRTRLSYIASYYLFYAFVCDGNIMIESKMISSNKNINVANIYKGKGIYSYELHNKVVEFLDSIWWNKCEALMWLDVKRRYGI